MGRRRAQRGRQQAGKHGVRLFGRHAVLAALANPRRYLHRLYGTAAELARLTLPDSLAVQPASDADLARLLPAGAVHQGLVLDVEPLDDLHLDEVLVHPEAKAPLVILDQVTDPHNVGAIIRSALAFGAGALITQLRHSPQETGTLARAASGALELLPWVRVVNLARALEAVAEAGYWRIGLAGDAPATLAEALGSQPTAIVLGAEGDGLRPNTIAHVDVSARLPISNRIDSLNVSNAAAVALYAIASRPVRPA